MILDCYQSAGIVPFDVTALERRLRRRRLGQVALRRARGTAGSTSDPTSPSGSQPTFTGWQAHERPFGFEEEMEYADGAARFLTGTPNVPALYAATAGYDLIEEIGVDADPRELAPPDAAPHRPRRRRRLRGQEPARAPTGAAEP